MDLDPQAPDKDEGWESIQDYGKFLQETADTFRTDASTLSPTPPRRAIPTSPENGRRIQGSNLLPCLDEMGWQKLRLNSDFAHLAPLTARENRIQAQQSAKLIDWISDSTNDEMFRGWGALDQAVDLPPESEETRLHREGIEREVLQRIVEEPDDESGETQGRGRGELGWRPADSRADTSFAKYLSLEMPQSSSRWLKPGVTSRQPSRSSSMGGSDEDTRSVVSQDNHWRRTIFG
jgi:hypothetical protein